MMMLAGWGVWHDVLSAYARLELTVRQAGAQIAESAAEFRTALGFAVLCHDSSAWHIDTVVAAHGRATLSMWPSEKMHVSI